MSEEASNPLAGAMARLNRAESHLRTVREGVDAFLASDFLSLKLDSDRAKRPVVRVASVRTPDDDLSVAIGECVYQLRSALDHVAYQLALAHTGDPLPDDIAGSSAFPIAKSGPKFKKAAPARLKGVSPKARAAIERLQPYHRRKMPDAKSLALLDALCNVDKHRMLHPTASMIVGTQFGIAGTGFFELQAVEVFPAELTPRAMVARYTGRFEGDVTFTQHLALDVIFGRDCAAQEARGKSVIGSLLAIRDYIAIEVMPALAVFLGGRYSVTPAADESAQ